MSQQAAMMAVGKTLAVTTVFIEWSTSSCKAIIDSLRVDLASSSEELNFTMSMCFLAKGSSDRINLTSLSSRLETLDSSSSETRVFSATR